MPVSSPKDTLAPTSQIYLVSKTEKLLKGDPGFMETNMAPGFFSTRAPTKPSHT